MGQRLVTAISAIASNQINLTSIISALSGSDSLFRISCALDGGLKRNTH